MEIGDIIRHRMIMEVDSVAIQNGFYYRVVDPTLGSTLAALVLQVHADWWDKLKDVMSDQSQTTCSIWENLNGNDTTFASFQTIAGAVVADNLPVQCAVPLTRKAVTIAGKIVTGTLKMSGIAETLQEGGHMLNYEIALGLEDWLTSDQLYGPTILRNVLPSKVGPVMEYNDVELAQTNPHIVQVPSRQPILCGTI